MNNIETLEDLAVIKENFEVEFKKATGQDGKGDLPKDFWKHILHLQIQMEEISF